MKAGWFERHGPALDVIRIGDLPMPEPAAGEVLVRIGWSGVNPSDVKRRARNAEPMPFPRIVPNMDGAGIVDAVGAGVPATRVGERVWLHSTMWKRPLGTAAQWTVTPSSRAFRLPDGVPLSVGAGLGVPAMTAHRAVFAEGSVAGRTVLVTGGAGAVGFYAIQLAKRDGARVLATVSSPGKAAIARTAGADETIDYRTEDVAARVLALTGGTGVDHIVEVDFGANLPVTVRCLRDSGTLATYASMTTPEPVLPFYAMMFRNFRVTWVFVYEMSAAALEAAGRDVNAWLESGRAVHPRYHRYPLADLAQAHLAVEQGAVGKVIVEVGGEQP